MLLQGLVVLPGLRHLMAYLLMILDLSHSIVLPLSYDEALQSVVFQHLLVYFASIETFFASQQEDLKCPQTYK